VAPDIGSEAETIAAGITRGIADSDLLLHLPEIMRRVQQEVAGLQAAAEATAAAAVSKASAAPAAAGTSKPAATCSPLLTHSSKFSTRPTVLQRSVQDKGGCAVLQSPLLEFARDLLTLHTNLLVLPGDPPPGLDACKLPAGRLAVATLQVSDVRAASPSCCLTLTSSQGVPSNQWLAGTRILTTALQTESSLCMPVSCNWQTCYCSVSVPAWNSCQAGWPLPQDCQ
jgi:hypothetical protein